MLQMPSRRWEPASATTMARRPSRSHEARTLTRSPKFRTSRSFPALDVHEPDLTPGRVPVAARVEQVGPLPVELGMSSVPLGTDQRDAFASLQVVPVEAGGLELLSRLRVEVRVVEEPAVVRVQLAAPEEMLRLRLRQRLQRLRRVESHTEEAHPLVSVTVLRDYEGFTVRCPGHHQRVTTGRLRQAERGRRAVRRGREHVLGGSEPRPAPRHPGPIGRDQRPGEDRDGEQGVEPAFLLQGNRR